MSEPTPPSNVTADSSAEKVLKNSLTKPGDESKRWSMTRLGLKVLAGVFAVSVAIVVIWPSSAGSVTTLAQIMITSVGGLIAVYLGGASATEWKASSGLQASIEKKDETRENTEIKEVRYTPKAKYFDGEDVS